MGGVVKPWAETNPSLVTGQPGRSVSPAAARAGHASPTIADQHDSPWVRAGAAAERFPQSVKYQKKRNPHPKRAAVTAQAGGAGAQLPSSHDAFFAAGATYLGESRPRVSKRAPRSVQGGESQHSHAHGLFPKSSSSDRQTDRLLTPEHPKTAAAQERDGGSAVRGAQAAAAPSPRRRDEVHRTLRGFATRLQPPLGQAAPGSAFTAARSQQTERVCFCCFFMKRSTANTGSSVLKNLQLKSERTTKVRKS